MDDAMVTPAYTQHEAAALVGTPPETFRRWARGYTTGSGTRISPFVTAAEGRGYTVPFVGLAEAWIVRAFSTAGVPTVRIRSAVEQLRKQIGLEHALVSEQLATDGADILWDMQKTDGLDTRLIVVRNNQAVFGEVVREHLKRIDYRDGFAGTLHFPRSDGADLTVDPTVNYGQPTLTRYGVRASDIRERVAAGDTIDEVAHDFDVPRATVSNLVLAVA